MEMDIKVEYKQDEHGFGRWYETVNSVRGRIAARLGFKESLVMVDDDSLFFDGSVVTECAFSVMGQHYYVSFDYDNPAKTVLRTM